MFSILLLYVHAFATWIMIGLILFIQVVYFPLYKRLETKFTPYDIKDIKHMGFLVAPIFFFELVSAALLALYAYHSTLYRMLCILNLLLLVSIWVVNYYLQVQKFGTKTLLFLDKMHHFLLTSNWYRTCVWCLRGVVVLAMLLLFDPNG